MGVFKIDVDQFSWINGPEDDPEDLCLHGHVTVQIGDAVLDDYATVSATALYLLKTLTEDKLMAQYDIQMVPCCGHFLIANKDLSEVTISGCDNGMDWSTIHENGGVRLILPNGEGEWVPFNEYKAEVLRFADKVEGYYAACRPKVIPTDEFDRNGYEAFWNEWHRRYDEAVLDSTQSKRIQHIRFAERESHEQIYISATLFEKGSWLEKPVKTVMDLLPLFDQYQSINALDLGCGVGRNAIPIAQYFENRQCHIDCVDLLSVAIQKLNENAKHYAVTDSIQGIISSIEAFSIKESSYDLIIAVSSLEHIENETLFNNKLQEIQSGLRENGIACFILNSEVCEYDPNANEQLDPQFEVNLPTQRLLEIMDRTFKGETVLKKVRSQQYPIPRGNKVIDLTTNVVTFVTRKSYTL